MSVNLAPGPFGVGGQFVDLNGRPLNGGLIYTYAAGTTTPQSTFTTPSTVLPVPNSNPIVLSANGMCPQEIWLTAGIAYKFLVTDSVGNVIYPYTMDNVSGINDFSSIPTGSEWIASGLTPTFVSTSSFTVPGDQTITGSGFFTAKRRLLVMETAGTIYGVVTSSSVTASITTVNVAMDGSVAIDSGINEVSYGLLDSVNPSIPQYIIGSGAVSVIYINGIPTISVFSPSTASNDIVNGSFAVNQRVTPPTADNSCFVDMWRLLLGAANAATIVQDTADVPVGAAYALKLLVGSGNNNKFGIFQPIENISSLKYQNNVCSVRVPLKATAALTNIKIGIIKWSGTADAMAASPISAWGASGTNPTLAAGWTYANVPASLTVTTAWADYTIQNVAMGTSINNVGILIWQDGTVSTQTSDIMRVGGYVSMTAAATSLSVSTKNYTDELLACQRYYNKTFPLGTAAAQNAGRSGDLEISSQASQVASIDWLFPTRMRVSPTMTYFSPGNASASWWDWTNSVTRGAASSPDTSDRKSTISAPSPAIAPIGLHATAIDTAFQP